MNDMERIATALESIASELRIANLLAAGRDEYRRAKPDHQSAINAERLVLVKALARVSR